MRQLLAEGRTTSYDKAELAAKLMDLKFDEDEAIYAANECSSLYMAISYLQQDCELCAGKYGVKEVSPGRLFARHPLTIFIFLLLRWCPCCTVLTGAAVDALGPIL